MADRSIPAFDMIVSSPKIKSGRPIIAGTTMRVQDIVAAHVYQGLSAVEVVEHNPTVNLGQVHAALAYYYENKAAIDRQIEEDGKFGEEARQEDFGQRRLPVFRR